MNLIGKSHYCKTGSPRPSSPSQPPQMSTFLDLPLEVAEQILIFPEPVDLASVSRTCKSLCALLYENKGAHVWRSAFLKPFDDPRTRIKIIAPLRLDSDEPRQDSSRNRLSARLLYSRTARNIQVESESSSDTASSDGRSTTETASTVHSPAPSQCSITSSAPSPFNWRVELQKRVLAQQILHSKSYTLSTSTNYSGLSAVQVMGSRLCTRRWNGHLRWLRRGNRRREHHALRRYIQSAIQCPAALHPGAQDFYSRSCPCTADYYWRGS